MEKWFKTAVYVMLVLAFVSLCLFDNGHNDWAIGIGFLVWLGLIFVAVVAYFIPEPKLKPEKDDRMIECINCGEDYIPTDETKICKWCQEELDSNTPFY